MKIAFLVRRPAEEGRSITPDVVQLLRDWRAEGDLIHLDSRPRSLDIRPEHDLYVLRTMTDASLSGAGILERQGARCVNPASVSGPCRDKALVTALLTDAGIPVPESWIVERPFQLAPLLEDDPMVIKPLHGSQGRGVRAVWDLDELLEVGAAEMPLIAQRYQPHQGRDRKLYCIGGRSSASSGSGRPPRTGRSRASRSPSPRSCTRLPWPWGRSSAPICSGSTSWSARTGRMSWMSIPSRGSRVSRTRPSGWPNKSTPQLSSTSAPYWHETR
jgi:hypothetical protein